MPKVQSPIIGNALRTSLGLEAAGGMPMEADTTIVPVAIVSDVRELITDRYIPVMQGSEQLAVAAEYSYSGLVWDSGALPTCKRILLDAVTVSAPGSVILWYGYKTGGLAGASLGLPRRKIASLSGSYVTGRVVNATNVNQPNTFIDRYSGLFIIAANASFRIVFQEPVVLDAENQAFVIGISTVNIALRCAWEWREERS